MRLDSMNTTPIRFEQYPRCVLDLFIWLLEMVLNHHSQVGKFIQLFATFIGGFVIAFSKGWLLSLVTLTSISPLVISGAVMTISVSKIATRGQAAYSKAGIVVEQKSAQSERCSFHGIAVSKGPYNFIISSKIRCVKSGIVYQCFLISLTASLILNKVIFHLFFRCIKIC